MQIIAETERLIVRPWGEEDVPLYIRMSKDIGYNCFATPGYYLVKDENEALDKIKMRMSLFEERGIGKFPLFTKNSNEFIGTCGFDPYKIDGRDDLELGYRLCLKYWNQGYGTESAKALIGYGFTKLGLKHICAFAAHQNTASLKILEKLGFKYLRDFIHAELPHKLYEYAKSDWTSQHKASKRPALSQAIDLRRANQPEKAITVLNDLLRQHPTDPDINYQMAWTNDFMGKEREAVPFYETAIANGLSGDDRKGAMLGLGSTLRCLGEYQKSLDVFDRAISEFPDDRSLKVFRALTQFNLGNFESSTSQILLQLIDTTTDKSIKAYDRALRFYSDKLNQIWE